MSRKRRRRKGSRFAIAVLILMFLTGLGVLLYPWINGYLVDSSAKAHADSFLSIVPADKPTQGLLEITPEEELPAETVPAVLYAQLRTAMENYNQTLFQEGQSGLTGSAAFAQTPFLLRDYGLDSEVFGVVSIPAIGVELPIYLGATEPHMAKGAAQMGQTSLPIGGTNSNCVLAGHRGYQGASFFRFVDQLRPGDRVIITNLWETLIYEVKETRIISPDDVDAIRIQPGRDLVTLLTCHPYASGGKQRMLIICERKQS